MIELTVTIATFKRPQLLEMVLDGLKAQSVSKENFEVLVCDSESGGETDCIVDGYAKFLNLRHLHTVNILAAKRNIGIANASSDFVIFLDDDCVPEFDFVKKYIEIKNKNERNKIYCGEVRFPVEWVAKSNYYKFRDSMHPVYPLENKVAKFNNIVVMNMGFWKADFLNKIKLVNENFIGYGCEDIELGWRMVNSGFEICMEGPSIIHFETSAGIRGYMIKMNRASRDGMASLLRHVPAAAESLRLAQFIEPSISSGKNRLIGFFIKLLCEMKLVTRGFIWFMDKTDGIRGFSLHTIYRFLMVTAVVNGIKERKNSIKIDDVGAGWY